MDEGAIFPFGLNVYLPPPFLSFQAMSKIRTIAVPRQDSVSALLGARTKSELVRATEQQDFTTHKMEDAFCDGDKCDLGAARAAAKAAAAAAAPATI